MRSASYRDSRVTWRRVGTEVEECTVSVFGRYRKETVLGVQACAHILRRSSGARELKRWKVAVDFEGSVETAAIGQGEVEVA